MRETDARLPFARCIYTVISALVLLSLQTQNGQKCIGHHKSIEAAKSMVKSQLEIVAFN